MHASGEIESYSIGEPHSRHNKLSLTAHILIHFSLYLVLLITVLHSSLQEGIRGHSDSCKKMGFIPISCLYPFRRKCFYCLMKKNDESTMRSKVLKMNEKSM
jgi:hypothetical protein